MHRILRIFVHIQMYRGSQTLTAIFTNNDPKLRKVNGSLLEDRDVAMAYRFYYHFQILRKRFDDIPKDMESEFWVTGDTIVKKLDKVSDLLKDINKNAPTRTQLRKRYPHFSWD